MPYKSMPPPLLEFARHLADLFVNFGLTNPKIEGERKLIRAEIKRRKVTSMMETK